MNLNEEIILGAFAKHLKKVRKELGYTQESLAGKADMDLSHIAKIETCKRNPKLSTLVQIARAMEIPLTALTNFEFDN